VDSGRWDRFAFLWQPTAASFSLRGYTYGVLGLHAITDFEPIQGEPPPDAAIWAVAQRKTQWTLVRNQAGQLEALQGNHFDGDNHPVAGWLEWFERDTTGRVARLTAYDPGGQRVREVTYDGSGRTARHFAGEEIWKEEHATRADLLSAWE
jgi:YD repeat-containing protein